MTQRNGGNFWELKSARELAGSTSALRFRQMAARASTVRPRAQAANHRRACDTHPGPIGRNQVRGSGTRPTINSAATSRARAMRRSPPPCATRPTFTGRTAIDSARFIYLSTFGMGHINGEGSPWPGRRIDPFVERIACRRRMADCYRSWRYWMYGVRVWPSASREEAPGPPQRCCVPTLSSPLQGVRQDTPRSSVVHRLPARAGSSLLST